MLARSLAPPEFALVRMAISKITGTFWDHSYLIFSSFSVVLNLFTPTLLFFDISFSIFLCISFPILFSRSNLLNFFENTFNFYFWNLCSGIGRTGTLCTLDICISRLEDGGTVDVRGTVERIRAQRAYSIQMPDQYIFCHLALIEYALSRGLIESKPDLSGFQVNKTWNNNNKTMSQMHSRAVFVEGRILKIKNFDSLLR